MFRYRIVNILNSRDLRGVTWTGALLLVLFLTLGGCSVASSGGDSSADNGGSSPTTETLLVGGQITDSGGAPVSGATVTIASETILGSVKISISSRSTTRAENDTTTTNESGYFFFEIEKEKGKSVDIDFDVSYQDKEGNEQKASFSYIIDENNDISEPDITDGDDTIQITATEVEVVDEQTIPDISGTYTYNLSLVAVEGGVSMKGVAVLSPNLQIILGKYILDAAFSDLTVDSAGFSFTIPETTLNLDVPCSLAIDKSISCELASINDPDQNYQSLSLQMSYNGKQNSLTTLIPPIITYDSSAVDDSEWGSADVDAKDYLNDSAADAPGYADLDYFRIATDESKDLLYFLLKVKSPVNPDPQNDPVVQYNFTFYNSKVDEFRVSIHFNGEGWDKIITYKGVEFYLYDNYGVNIDYQQSFVKFALSLSEVESYAYEYLYPDDTMDITEFTNMGLVITSSDATLNTFYDYLIPLKLFTVYQEPIIIPQ